MSKQDQRVLDGIKVISDAHLAGRIDALEKVRETLRRHKSACDAVLGSEGSAVDKMKARGAGEEIDALLEWVGEEITTAQSQRAT